MQEHIEETNMMPADMPGVTPSDAGEALDQRVLDAEMEHFVAAMRREDEAEAALDQRIRDTVADAMNEIIARLDAILAEADDDRKLFLKELKEILRGRK